MNIIEREERPWGYFEVLADGEGFKTKLLCVNPGERLSLQSHNHRSELWCVITGEATVVVDDKSMTLFPEDHIFIPCGSTHRISNLTSQKLKIVEIQIGSYLEEDDIVRYEDDYNRE
jgi:mannose-6-phosphate isomerase-like protein (cupin superfamily)